MIRLILEAVALAATRVAPGVPVHIAAEPGAALDRACEAASRAFDAFRGASLEQRAALLEGIAAHIAGIGDELIVRAMAETLGVKAGALERGMAIPDAGAVGAGRDGSPVQIGIAPAASGSGFCAWCGCVGPS